MWTLQVTVSGVLFLLTLKDRSLLHPAPMTENPTLLRRLRGTELVFGQTLVCHIA